MGFPAGFVDRKDSYIVYLKEGDAVIDFLGMMEADEAVESFEVARNVKEVREQVNRLVNCETANLQKAVDAAGRQLAIIRALEKDGKLASLPSKVRAAAKARLENPDATLQELAEMLGISKSGMNHRMRKLKEIAEQL
jgi:DNA-binding protein WhiA